MKGTLNIHSELLSELSLHREVCTTLHRLTFCTWWFTINNGYLTCARSQSLLNILSTSLAWVMVLMNGKHNVHDIFNCE